MAAVYSPPSIEREPDDDRDDDGLKRRDVDADGRGHEQPTIPGDEAQTRKAR